jgi:hypothetical protein
MNEVNNLSLSRFTSFRKRFHYIILTVLTGVTDSLFASPRMKINDVPILVKMTSVFYRRFFHPWLIFLEASGLTTRVSILPSSATHLVREVSKKCFDSPSVLL